MSEAMSEWVSWWLQNSLSDKHKLFKHATVLKVASYYLISPAMAEAGYGTWKSPITSTLTSQSGVRLNQLRADTDVNFSGDQWSSLEHVYLYHVEKETLQEWEFS